MRYVRAEGRHLVDDQVQKIVGCRFPGQQLELVVYRPTPGNDDTRCDLQSCQRHSQSLTAHTHKDGTRSIKP